jgi:hypothetical protein
MAPKTSHVELKDFNMAFNLRKDVPIPDTRDIPSWRAYVEGGERKFCDFERTLLVKFIKRMTGVRGELVFPDWFENDRQTAIYLWCEYVAARQSPSQAAERLKSVSRYVGTWGEASLKAARKQLNENIKSNPDIRAQFQKRRKVIEAMKNFDYSKHRYGKAIVYKEGPIRHKQNGKLSLTQIRVKKTHKRQLVDEPMKVDDTSVSSLFVVKVADPKPIEKFLRRDQNIRNHMVKRGRESPLRQSISRRELSEIEQDIEALHHQLLGEVQNLKRQIVELEEKNYIHRPSRKLVNSPQSSPHKLDGR